MEKFIDEDGVPCVRIQVELPEDAVESITRIGKLVTLRMMEKMMSEPEAKGTMVTPIEVLIVGTLRGIAKDDMKEIPQAEVERRWEALGKALGKDLGQAPIVGKQDEDPNWDLLFEDPNEPTIAALREGGLAQAPEASRDAEKADSDDIWPEDEVRRGASH